MLAQAVLQREGPLPPLNPLRASVVCRTLDTYRNARSSVPLFAETKLYDVAFLCNPDHSVDGGTLFLAVKGPMPIIVLASSIQHCIEYRSRIGYATRNAGLRGPRNAGSN